MITKKKKNQKSGKEKFFEIFFFVIALSVFGFLLFSNIKVAKKRLSLINEVESLNKRVEFLKDRKKMLEARISETETNEYWEGVMREQGYIKKGEESVVILSPEDREVSKEKKQDFLQMLLEKLKKLFIIQK